MNFVLSFGSHCYPPQIQQLCVINYAIVHVNSNEYLNSEATNQPNGLGIIIRAKLTDHSNFYCYCDSSFSTKWHLIFYICNSRFDRPLILDICRQIS